MSDPIEPEDIAESVRALVRPVPPPTTWWTRLRGWWQLLVSLRDLQHAVHGLQLIAQTQQHIIEGQRRDYDAMLQAQRFAHKLVSDLAQRGLDESTEATTKVTALDRRLSYYEEHNDSLRFTAKQLRKLLDAEQRASSAKRN